MLWRTDGVVMVGQDLFGCYVTWHVPLCARGVRRQNHDPGCCGNIVSEAEIGSKVSLLLHLLPFTST